MTQENTDHSIAIDQLPTTYSPLHLQQVFEFLVDLAQLKCWEIEGNVITLYLESWEGLPFYLEVLSRKLLTEGFDTGDQL